MARLYAALMFNDDDPKERIYRNRVDAFSMYDDTFVDTFRLTKDLVNIICEEIREDLRPISGVRTALSVETQVLCTLQFFASGSYQKVIGRDMFLAISQASVSRCVKKVTEALNRRMLKREISFPSTEEYPDLKRQFMETSGFPGIIGAIDCTHVLIIAPPEPHEPSYINRKGLHSINVQLVCDSNLRILNINAKHPGRNHDSFIWRFSELRSILLEEHSANIPDNGWLLGDSGYPLEPWLMTPILHPISRSENSYNSAHRKTRNVIERLNGVLKSRFRCLSKHRTLNMSPTMASKVVNACAILHNLCVRYNVPFDDIIYEDDDTDNNVVTTTTGNAVTIRNRLIRNHFF